GGKGPLEHVVVEHVPVAVGLYPYALARAGGNQALGGEHFYRFANNAAADVELCAQLRFGWKRLVDSVVAAHYGGAQIVGDLMGQVTTAVESAHGKCLCLPSVCCYFSAPGAVIGAGSVVILGLHFPPQGADNRHHFR